MENYYYFDNKKYLSSRLAGEVSGFTNDYISRLCRQEKIIGKKVEQTWYVEEQSLLSFIELNKNTLKKQRSELSRTRKLEYVYASQNAQKPSLHKDETDKKREKETETGQKKEDHASLSLAETSKKNILSPTAPLRNIFAKEFLVLTAIFLFLFVGSVTVAKEKNPLVRDVLTYFAPDESPDGAVFSPEIYFDTTRERLDARASLQSKNLAAIGDTVLDVLKFLTETTARFATAVQNTLYDQFGVRLTIVKEGDTGSSIFKDVIGSQNETAREPLPSVARDTVGTLVINTGLDVNDALFVSGRGSFSGGFTTPASANIGNNVTIGGITHTRKPPLAPP